MSNPEMMFILLDGGRHDSGYRAAAQAALGRDVRITWIDWVDGRPAVRERELDELLPDATALVATPWLGAAPTRPMPEFDDRRWALAPLLRVIAGTFDFRFRWIDVADTQRRGVALVDTSRTMTPTVAEFGLAMILNLLRQIPDAVELVRRGGWITEPPRNEGFVYGDLRGRRVGLAGYGSINRGLRRLLEPFDCQVVAFDPFAEEELLIRDHVRRAESLVELAAHAEILVVAIPPTPTTLRVVDSEVIDSLSSGSLFVLLSRMAVVEQEALWARVQARQLRVAVDVFDPEPPPSDAWYRTHVNVLATPHIAGNVDYAHRRCLVEACKDALRVASGARAIHTATPHDAWLYGPDRAVRER